jgi:chemotaxis protein CheD
MKNKAISINETDVTDEAVIYTCFGVGSCIAVFLNDRMTGLAGGAHIPLAYDTPGEWLSASAILGELLSKFRSKGSNLNFLRAKIAGGADLFQSVKGPGSDNIRAIYKELAAHKIYISAEDLGGTSPRTARFNTRTGELMVSSSERNRLTL